MGLRTLVAPILSDEVLLIDSSPMGYSHLVSATVEMS